MCSKRAHRDGEDIAGNSGSSPEVHPIFLRKQVRSEGKGPGQEARCLPQSLTLLLTGACWDCLAAQAMVCKCVYGVCLTQPFITGSCAA